MNCHPERSVILRSRKITRSRGTPRLTGVSTDAARHPPRAPGACHPDRCAAQRRDLFSDLRGRARLQSCRKATKFDRGSRTGATAVSVIVHAGYPACGLNIAECPIQPGFAGGGFSPMTTDHRSSWEGTTSEPALSEVEGDLLLDLRGRARLQSCRKATKFDRGSRTGATLSR